MIDTDLVLSSLVFGGGTRGALRQRWHKGRCVPLVSNVTASGLFRVLTYPKFKLSPDEREELLADYLPWRTTVDIPDPPPTTPTCRDPSNQPFLELAPGNADSLLAGDADLHELAGRSRCPIVRAAVFLETVRIA